MERGDGSWSSRAIRASLGETETWWRTPKSHEETVGRFWAGASH